MHFIKGSKVQAVVFLPTILPKTNVILGLTVAGVGSSMYVHFVLYMLLFN